MCGIIGFLERRVTEAGEKLDSENNRDIASIITVALERLSYRGYDSSGMAVVGQGELNVWKKSGKLTELKHFIDGLRIRGTGGIGHTRWATHGEPSDINAHPQISGDSPNKVAVVHNGIIENYLDIKKILCSEDKRVFSSVTDSEVISHLLSKHWENEKSSNNRGSKTNIINAGRKTFSALKGSFAVAALFEEQDHAMLVARQDSPLMIGISEKGFYACSDLNIILYHTSEFIELNDGEMALLTNREVEVYEVTTGEKVEKEVQRHKQNIVTDDLGNYDHWMLKEIFEQAEVCRTILNHYVEGVGFSKNFIQHRGQSELDLLKVNRFLIQACGTSWHAGMIAKYWIEQHARVFVEVDISSELRYRTLLSNEHDIVLAISQSGETADTLACIREAKSHFLKVLSFLNVGKSTIDRESDGVVFSHAGREVGVASTKNYFAQLVTLYLFSVKLAFAKGHLSEAKVKEKLDELSRLPDYLEQILSKSNQLKRMAEKYVGCSEFIFVGRGVNYPTALEGALKLKEISYLHATGYAAGELKHGPLALIDSTLPVVCMAPKTSLYPKMFSNIQEIKSRKGRIITITTEGNDELDELSESIFKIPPVSEELSPLLSVVPLQLFSYYLAVKLGNDVDQPKNLAKSVTVE